MPGLLYYDEIKAALGLPPNCRQSRVVKALRKRNLPFEYGERGVFTTLEAWNAKIMGVPSTQPQTKDDEPIEFFK